MIYRHLWFVLKKNFFIPSISSTKYSWTPNYLATYAFVPIYHIYCHFIIVMMLEAWTEKLYVKDLYQCATGSNAVFHLIFLFILLFTEKI